MGHLFAIFITYYQHIIALGINGEVACQAKGFSPVPPALPVRMWAAITSCRQQPGTAQPRPRAVSR